MKCISEQKERLSICMKHRCQGKIRRLYKNKMRIVAKGVRRWSMTATEREYVASELSIITDTYNDTF